MTKGMTLSIRYRCARRSSTPPPSTMSSRGSRAGGDEPRSIWLLRQDRTPTGPEVEPGAATQAAANPAQGSANERPQKPVKGVAAWASIFPAAAPALFPFLFSTPSTAHRWPQSRLRAKGPAAVSRWVEEGAPDDMTRYHAKETRMRPNTGDRAAFQTSATSERPRVGPH